MKNDKLLTKLLQIEDALLTESTGFVHESLRHLITEVEDEIREEENKHSGKDSIAKAALNILKTAPGFRESLKKAYRGKKWLTVSDTYRAVRFKLQDAPVLPEHPENYSDYPNIDCLVREAARYHTASVEVPTIGDLQALIRIEKAKLKAQKDKSKGVKVRLTSEHNEVIPVNAEFLLDMLKALPGALVTCAVVHAPTRALYFKAANGDGILMPTRT